MDGDFLPALLPWPLAPTFSILPVHALGFPAHRLLQVVSFTLSLCSGITSNSKPSHRFCGQMGSNIFSFLFH